MNTALLTASGLMIRFVGMLWQIWLVGRIGEVGIGLFQLVLSVAALASTVAVSGSRYTTTRLVSEELGVDCPGGAARALTVCLLYGLFFGLAAGLVLMLLAEPVGFLWLGDARTVRPLMLLAIEMPLTGLDAVMHGYFTAVGRVWKSVCIGIGQQLVTIAVTAAILVHGPSGNIEYACRAVTLGRVLGAAAEAAVMWSVFVRDRRTHGIRCRRSDAPLPRMTERALSAALPLAAASYARSGLSTLQHLLVPIGLTASGLAAEAALAGYGVVQGMALPVVLFPACVMTAAAELIVPKLTETQVQNDVAGIRDTAGAVLRLGLRFSLLCAAILLALGDRLGLALYGSAEAGRYIRLLSLIVPVMYLDTLTDGCLKGLGEMMFCMYVNIADAGLSALMVWLLLPRWGLPAYLFTICFTETFNFVLSMLRLRRTAKLRTTAGRLLRAFLPALAAGLTAFGLSKAINAGNSVPALIVCGLSGVASAVFTERFLQGTARSGALGITSGEEGEEEREAAGRRASG